MLLNCSCVVFFFPYCTSVSSVCEYHYNYYLFTNQICNSQQLTAVDAAMVTFLIKYHIYNYFHAIILFGFELNNFRLPNRVPNWS